MHIIYFTIKNAITKFCAPWNYCIGSWQGFIFRIGKVPVIMISYENINWRDSLTITQSLNATLRVCPDDGCGFKRRYFRYHSNCRAHIQGMWWTWVWTEFQYTRPEVWMKLHPHYRQIPTGLFRTTWHLLIMSRRQWQRSLHWLRTISHPSKGLWYPEIS